MKYALAVAVVLALLLLFEAVGCSSTTKGPSQSETPTLTPVQASASSTGSALWPLPSDPLARVGAAGLAPEWRESLQHHVHAHLDVYVNGQHETVPGGIGIDISDPGVQRSVVDGQPAYGGIDTCLVQACISPLHTHDATGIIHTESATNTDHTLGEFFTEWGVRLDSNCVGDYCSPSDSVAVYVNGAPSSGNPQDILLTDQKEIAIAIGKPPPQIPSTADFSNA